ncbi:hypothetical protein ACFW1M_19420 [Streptomyces inhibens]|uniref:hypothetical protein n=1 Tax=Streptomyces inhibens TaxID=2293571 RepID=UPI0036B0F201
MAVMLLEQDDPGHARNRRLVSGAFASRAVRGITVNAVLPGRIDTPMLRRELAAQADEIGADPA